MSSPSGGSGSSSAALEPAESKAASDKQEATANARESIQKSLRTWMMEMVRLYVNRAKRELPGSGGGRKALASRLKQLPAVRTQLSGLQRGALELPPPRLRRQQTATQGTVRIAAKIKRTHRQVPSIPAAGDNYITFL